MDETLDRFPRFELNDAITTSQVGPPLTVLKSVLHYRTKKALVKLLSEEPQLPPRDPPVRFRKTVPTCWLEMTLTEGKNRQVRRMTAAVGFPTLRLVRCSIAHLQLEGLAPGEWRHLTAAEREKLLRL